MTTVAEPPPSPGTGDYVCVMTWVSSHPAWIARALLDAHEIPSVILGDFASDTLRWNGVALRPVELYVPAADAERAQELLRELDAAPSGRGCGVSDSERQRPDWECDHCHERNPGPFDSCWCCGTPSPQAAAPHRTQS